MTGARPKAEEWHRSPANQTNATYQATVQPTNRTGISYNHAYYLSHITCGAGDTTRIISPRIFNISPSDDCRPNANEFSAHSNTVNEPIRLNQCLKIGFWNVRTLLDPVAQGITIMNLERYGVDIACLSETRLPGNGNQVIKVPTVDKEYHLYHSGPTDHSGLGGVVRSLQMHYCRGNLCLQESQSQDSQGSLLISH